MFAEDLEDIDYNNIIICDPIKNSVIDYSNFYKIIYSNNFISYNGLFTMFKLNNVIINKDKVFLNDNNNNDNNNNENNSVFKELKNIEEYVTNLCNKSKIKKINYKLKDFLNNNYFKFVNNDDISKFNNCNNLNILSNYDSHYESDSQCDPDSDSGSKYHYFILKISGLWETKENIGMTFKIIKINNYL